MADKANRVDLFDVAMTAASPISAVAIAGVTPILSGWQKTKGVESVTMKLDTSGGTVTGNWTVQGSNSESAVKPAAEIVDITTIPSQAAMPAGGTLGAAIKVLTGLYHFIQLVFTPTGGAGNATMQLNGKIQGRPVNLHQNSYGSLFIFVAAADTLAGSFLVEGSNHWPGIGAGNGANGLMVSSDNDFTDVLPSPVLAALVASTGVKRLVRLGISTDGANGVIEYGALRCSFTPTAGFGSPLVSGMFKGS